MRCYTLSPVMRGEATHTFCLLSMCDAVSFLRQIKESMLGSRSQSVLSVPRSWTDRWPAYSGSTVEGKVNTWRMLQADSVSSW